MAYIQWEEADESAYQLDHSVHIWKIFFSDYSNEEAFYSKILSHAELARSSRFHFQIDSIRYKVSRVVAKVLLSKVLSIKPSNIELQLNDYGKPKLIAKSNNIFFNVSHSANLGLIAITDIGPIGIDVERYRKKMLAEKFARRFFSESEVKEYLDLPHGQKEEGFFNCWTRKEAFIKALGLGLAMPLKDFDVTLTPGEVSQLIEVRNRKEQAAGWLLKNIPLKEDYAAAFSINANNVQEKYWLFNKSWI